VLQRQGDYAAAEVLHRDALEKAERLYGEVHEQAIVCLHGLASLLEERGQYESADIAYHRALANARQIFGKRHPRVASLLSDLGMLAAQRGDFTTAERHLRESLSMQRRLYDGPHPSLASCIHNLAWLLFYGRGTYGDAEQLFREALAMRRAVYGERHQEVLTSLEYLTRLRLRPTSVYASGFGVGWRTSTLSRNDPTLLAKRDPPSVLPRGKASLDLASFGRLAGPVKASLRRFAALTGPASRPEWPGIEECQADAGGSI